MKKIFAIIILAAAVSVSAIAQPKAIGVRGGWGALEASYEHYAGSPHFFEFNVGLDYYWNFGFKAAALYNFTVAQPSWTSRGEWGIYAGLGVATGYCANHTRINDELLGRYSHFYRGFMFSVPVQAGLEYTFWFPLQLSVDLRPYFGLSVDSYPQGDGRFSKTYFYNEGLYGFIPTLSVRYCF